MAHIDLSGLAEAGKKLATLTTPRKQAVLLDLALRIEKNSASILAANQQDLNEAASSSAGLSAPMMERLTLNPKRLADMVAGLREIASLPDPVNEVIERSVNKAGLNIEKLRWPMGTIMVIFESRPNIITEVFALGFFAGNAMILKGGKESANTSAAIYTLIKQSLSLHFHVAYPFFGDNLLSRDDVQKLLQEKDQIQLLIPRGGDALMRFCEQHSKIPMLKNDRGLCHTYVHEDADQAMSIKVVENAKNSRPSVCNSLETLLIHKSVAAEFLPHIFAATAPQKTIWHCCPRSFDILKPLSDELVKTATDSSFDTEYLDYQLSCRIVDSLSEAMAHIEKHGSRHSETILTSSADTAKAFFLGVNSAAIYWNSSTRFTDGGQFGLGGEIGISTERVFHRGPIGLKDLTTPRYWVHGNGQIRQ